MVQPLLADALLCGPRSRIGGPGQEADTKRDKYRKRMWVGIAHAAHPPRRARADIVWNFNNVQQR
jgi:hypothetical protein